MVEIKPGWKVKGIYNECCASEGPCPYYFHRDVAGGCRYYMVFRITEGKVNGVDLAGITLVYNGDIIYPKWDDFVRYGAEGGLYISDNATEKQRKLLDTLAVKDLGGHFLKKCFGVKYVPMDIVEEDNGETFYIKHPYGEMKMSLVKGYEDKPIILENTPWYPVLQNCKAAHTYWWTYKDYDKNMKYTDRCGAIADFVFEG